MGICGTKARYEETESLWADLSHPVDAPGDGGTNFGHDTVRGTDGFSADATSRRLTSAQRAHNSRPRSPLSQGLTLSDAPATILQTPPWTLTSQPPSLADLVLSDQSVSDKKSVSDDKELALDDVQTTEPRTVADKLADVDKRAAADQRADAEASAAVKELDEIPSESAAKYQGS